MNARDREIYAIKFLLSGESPASLAVKGQFEETMAVLAYVRADVPDSLAMTDPQLYRRLRNRVTELKMMGYGLKKQAGIVTEEKPDTENSDALVEMHELNNFNM